MPRCWLVGARFRSLQLKPGHHEPDFEVVADMSVEIIYIYIAF